MTQQQQQQQRRPRQVRQPGKGRDPDPGEDWMKPSLAYPPGFTDREYDFEYDEALPGVTAPNMLAQRAIKYGSSNQHLQDWGADRSLRLERLWIESASSLEVSSPEQEQEHENEHSRTDAHGGRPSEGSTGSRHETRSPVFVETIANSSRAAVGSQRISARWMSWLCSMRRPKHSAAVAPRLGGSSPEVVEGECVPDDAGGGTPSKPEDFLPRRQGNNVGAAVVGSEEVVLQVPQGMIALTWLDSQPLLLPSGFHSYASRSFTIQEFVPESTRVIHHGCLHRVVMPPGHVGIAWVDGRAEILEPGVFERSCITFSYSTANDQKLSDKELVLGPYRIIVVNEDEVGIKFSNRKPQVLHCGRHMIDISKAEVFAGFESLLCRRSRISELVATTADDMRVEAQLSFHWQIGAEDAAAARVANVADVEGAVSAKFRRAFALVMWCYKGRDIVDMHAKSDLSRNDLIHISQMSSSFSSDISKECLEVVVDLFEEGWTVTFWEVQLERLQLYLDTPGQSADEQTQADFTDQSVADKETMYRQKKKVRIRLNEPPKVSASSRRRG